MLIDTTLREGAQTYGVYLDIATRRELIKAMAQAGIEEMEIGWVGQEDLPEILSWAKGLVAPMVLSVWSRLKESDIIQAAEAGVTHLSIGVPVSDTHLNSRLKMSRSELLTALRDLVPLARNKGMQYVSIGFEDASRADVEFLKEVAARCAALGVDRIRVADTVGVLDPGEMTTLVGRVKSVFPGPVAVHCHDDFGMATANAITSLAAGAEAADVTILGIGERTGVSRLEEVASFLTLRRKGKEYDLPRIREACQRLETAAGIDVPRNKPVCGRDIFSTETGLHAHGVMQNPELFEPYPPQAIGHSDKARTIGLGAKTGRSVVKSAMQRLGLAGNPGNIAQATNAIRETAKSLGRPLTPAELTTAVSRT